MLTKSYSQTLNAATAVWNNRTADTIDERDMTASIETARRHAMESNTQATAAVHALEVRLKVATRWVAGSAGWEDAARKVAMRQYQRCIDVLEALVVARIFELTKMNMSQTGNIFNHDY